MSVEEIARLAEEMRGNKRQHDNGGGPRILPPPSMPMPVARQFLDSTCMFEDGRIPMLRYWRGGWWLWRISFWQEIDESALRSLLYKFTEEAIYFNDADDPKPWAPNRKRIGDLAEALSAVCILPTNLDQPCWLDAREAVASWPRPMACSISTGNGYTPIRRSSIRRRFPSTMIGMRQSQGAGWNFSENYGRMSRRASMRWPNGLGTSSAAAWTSIRSC
jgi:hypothetical protein